MKRQRKPITKCPKCEERINHCHDGRIECGCNRRFRHGPQTPAAILAACARSAEGERGRPAAWRSEDRVCYDSSGHGGSGDGDRGAAGESRTQTRTAMAADASKIANVCNHPAFGATGTDM